MKIDEKLALNAVKSASQSHIQIDQKLCRQCTEKFCLSVCPGHLYKLSEETGEIQVEFAGCLECGTCRTVCVLGAVKWNHPKGGFGVQYRHG